MGRTVIREDNEFPEHFVLINSSTSDKGDGTFLLPFVWEQSLIDESKR